MTQFGSTPDVYRNPTDATTARVFSDPPMNFSRLRKVGIEIHYGDEQTVPAGIFVNLPDGEYLAGFRPNHLQIEQPSADALVFQGHVLGTEITGSESFVHIDHDGDAWVALVHGIHHLDTDHPRHVFVDPRHVYLFGTDDRLITAAAYAQAA